MYTNDPGDCRKQDRWDRSLSGLSIHSLDYFNAKIIVIWISSYMEYLNRIWNNCSTKFKYEHVPKRTFPTSNIKSTLLSDEFTNTVVGVFEGYCRCKNYFRSFVNEVHNNKRQDYQKNPRAKNSVLEKTKQKTWMTKRQTNRKESRHGYLEHSEM